MRFTLVMILALLSVSRGAAADLLDLSVGDLLAKPGESVEVVAKLEKKAPRGTNVPRVSIELRLDGKSVGRADTDERGFARFKVTAPDAGDHALKAVYDGTKDLMRAEYTGLLAVRQPADPLLIVDIDWTLAMTDDLNTAAGGADCPPLVGAPEAVTGLAKTHTVVYLSSRARQLRKRTISWLFRYGFPRGVTYFLDPSDYPTYDVVAFKTSILKDLTARFTGIKAGIGNDADDAAAYAAVNLRALTIGKLVWPAVEQELASPKGK